MLVGRESHQARAAAVLTRVANSGEATAARALFTGAPGLGKTVMLGVIADLAVDRRFVVAQVSLDRVSDNVQVLASLLQSAAQAAREKTTPGSWCS